MQKIRISCKNGGSGIRTHEPLRDGIPHGFEIQS
jgi:hypothetical protein